MLDGSDDGVNYILIILPGEQTLFHFDFEIGIVTVHLQWWKDSSVSGNEALVGNLLYP